MLPIAQVAATSGLLPDELEMYGESRAKIRLSVLDRLKDRPNGKMIIVTAVTPTKAGEGKTTTSISLTMGLGKRDKKVMLCLREPSMGPVFGVKGGGTGGGKALVLEPSETASLRGHTDVSLYFPREPSEQADDHRQFGEAAHLDRHAKHEHRGSGR